MGKLRTYQEQLQEIIDKGIRAVEEQQKKLAARPFEYAEKLESGVREYSVRKLRKRYDHYTESLFGQLRDLNSRFGNFAADLVARLEKESEEGAEAVSELAEDVQEAAGKVQETVGKVEKAGREAAAAVTEKPAARKSQARKPAAKSGAAAKGTPASA